MHPEFKRRVAVLTSVAVVTVVSLCSNASQRRWPGFSDEVISAGRSSAVSARGIEYEVSTHWSRLERAFLEKIRDAGETGPRGWVEVLGAFNGKDSERVLRWMISSGDRPDPGAVRALHARGVQVLQHQLERLTAWERLYVLVEYRDPRAVKAAFNVAGLPSTQFSSAEVKAARAGRALASMKPIIGQQLRTEISNRIVDGQSKPEFVMLLTAIINNPVPADAPILRSVLERSASDRVEMLAAIGLAHLGKQDVAPILAKHAERVVRGESTVGNSVWTFFDLSESRRQRLLMRRGPSWVQPALPGAGLWLGSPTPLSPVESDAVLVGRALRRVGDHSVVPLALTLLIELRQPIVGSSLEFIAASTGSGTIDLVESALAEHPVALKQARNLYRNTLRHGVDGNAAVRLESARSLAFGADPYLGHAPVQSALADRLVEASRLEWERPARPIAQIAESLALLDDPRAIDVVGDDSLLLSHIAWSIPGGPPRSNLHDGLKFNRVEDAMALSAWLSSNR
ncbi:MAG: hypothetical protein AAGI53_08730 [Planctomycetota bacterium]